MFLPGLAEIELFVSYSPKSTLPHRAVVFFEEDSNRRKIFSNSVSRVSSPAHFQLPLLGYGGSSKVVFEVDEIKMKGKKKDLNESENETVHVVARNMGTRAAYIRATCEDGGKLQLLIDMSL